MKPPKFREAPSSAGPGINVHLDGGVKLRVGEAPGVNLLRGGVVAITAAALDVMHAASVERRRGGTAR